MISAVNTRQKKEREARREAAAAGTVKLPRNYEEQRIRRENKMLHKYGLERVDDVDIEVANLKRFKPSFKKENEENQV